MSETEELIRELAEYALTKKGAVQHPSYQFLDPLVEPHIELSGPSWGTFIEVERNEDERFACLPVRRDSLARHREKYPAIRESSWMERDGHVFMEVPLDKVPKGYLKDLIDEAYAIVWHKLDERALMEIELTSLPYDEPALLDRLIDQFQLQSRRNAIYDVARKAILLRTRRASESEIPLGATKIGGCPDLPAEIDWPRYSDGKPLAFLGQIDLSAIATLPAPTEGLPKQGLLSVFSVWGWLDEGTGDPCTPKFNRAWGFEQPGWTVVIHSLPGRTLTRRAIPAGVNSFVGAAVVPTPVVSLPYHKEEPAVAALCMSDQEYRRFDEMQEMFCVLQKRHWFRVSDSFASHHLLGGYAQFQQGYPEELVDSRLAMFLQIGSDGNTSMFWGDSGELTFYTDAEALSQGRFERLRCIFQCA